MHAPEIQRIPRAERINAYLYLSIEDIQQILQTLDEKKKMNWEELDAFFLQELQW